MGRLAPLGIVVAGVEALEQALASEQVAHREMVVTISTAAGPLRAVGNPIKIVGQPTVYGPPPLLGEHHFNEVFFDDVRVGREALIGRLHRGWYQIAAQLDFERSGIERVISNWLLLADALALLCGTPALRDPVVRDRLAALHVDLEVARLLVYRTAATVDGGGRVPNVEAAMSKLFGTELEQRVAETVSSLLGMAGLLLPGAPGAPLGGRAVRSALYAPAYTIQGGTSHVLRNIIAQRGLGLPPD